MGEKHRQCDADAPSPGKTRRAVKCRDGRQGKLRRWLGDEDLADKIPSLLFRLIFAFEELQVGGRSPGVYFHSKAFLPVFRYTITIVTNIVVGESC